MKSNVIITDSERKEKGKKGSWKILTKVHWKKKKEVASGYSQPSQKKDR